MAISINNYILENGLTAETSYHRVEQLNGDKYEISFDVKVFLTRESMLEGMPILEQKFFKFAPDTSETAKNFITQCYEHMKTLPQYLNAIDIYELD